MSASSPSPLPDKLRELIESRLAEARAHAPALLSRDGEGLLVTGSIGTFGYVKPNGDVYMERDELLDGNVVVDGSESARTEVLVLGARKFPELSQLLPTRKRTSGDCTICLGTGRTKLPIGTTLCTTCHGLGWV